MNQETPAPNGERTEERYDVAINATLHESGGQDRSIQITNVTENGFFIATDAPPKLRSFVRVTADLPDTYGGLKISGLVQHIQPANRAGSNGTQGVGVKLYGNSKDVLEHWANYVRRLGKEPNADTSSSNETGDHDSDIPELTLELADGDALFELYAFCIPRGRTFVPTDLDINIGDKVSLKICLKGHDENHVLNATVLSRRHPPAQPGVDIGITKLRPDDLSTLWHLLCDPAELTESPAPSPHSS